MAKGISITGSGIICAIGTDKETVLESLRGKKTGIDAMRYLSSVHKELPVGEVKLSNDELRALLGVVSDEDISRTTLLGAYALKQAIENSGLTKEYMSAKRLTLISGTTVGGMDVTERHYRRMLDGDMDALRYVLQHDCGSNTEAIARLCDLDCESTTISTACSSALNAIILGARMLLAGETDIVFAGGTEALSVFHLNGFNSLMILDKEQCRPFDATRQGLNLGEGAAYVVLERSHDSELRDAHIEGYIGGYGNYCDAFHQTATSPEGEGAYLAMRDALNMAGIPMTSVDYINAHGTGTPNNDQSESVALRRLFGEYIPPVSSTKSYTGHTTSASGSIETIISLIAMRNGFIPVNLSWEKQCDSCIVPYMGNEKRQLHYVLCNSFGFGGNDSSLLLSDKEILLDDIGDMTYDIVAECDVNSIDDLKNLKQYVSSMELRRMGKITKSAFLSSMRALEMAGVESPDAIVIATRFGMLENGEGILTSLLLGEEGISPTQFMQSTHNTLAGLLAIKLKCHGYNITYSHGDDSLAWAMRDAKKLLAEGLAKTVLVGIHDEYPEVFRSFYERLNLPLPAEIYSKSIIIKAL